MKLSPIRFGVLYPFGRDAQVRYSAPPLGDDGRQYLIRRAEVKAPGRDIISYDVTGLLKTTNPTANHQEMGKVEVEHGQLLSATPWMSASDPLKQVPQADLERVKSDILQFHAQTSQGGRS